MLRPVDSPPSRLAAALRTGDAAFAESLVLEAVAAGQPALEVLGRIACALRLATGSEETERRAHLACEHLLAVTLPSLLDRACAQAERVIVAGALGERHALGLRVAACAAESAGYDVRYLGASVEPFVLARMVAEQCPRAVVIGAEAPGSLPALHQSVAAVHVSAPDARVLAYGLAARGRSRVLGATVAEDPADLARLLAPRLARVA